MTAWYLMGQLTKRGDLPARIRDAARRLGCLQDLDSIRLEKGWSRIKQGQGVYCAFGFADPRPESGTDAPEPPFDAETLAERLHMTILVPGNLLKSIVAEEYAINWTQESMISGDPVEQIDRAPPPDPAEVDTVRESVARDAANPDSQVHGALNDRLLCWLSAMQSGTWGQFAEACRALGLDRFSKPGDTLVRLLLLGHIEVSVSGDRWSVVPAMIVGGLNGHWFLCGQRSEPLLAELAQHAPVDQVPQMLGSGPRCVRIALSGEQIENGSLALGVGVIPIVTGASARIADYLPEWTEWYQHVRGNYKPDLSAAEIVERVLASGVVETVRPTGADGGRLTVPEGLYRLTFRHGFTACVRAYCDADGLWTRCDWYGMSFLAQRQAGTSLAYRQGDELIVPADQPWPRIYERPLVLASGLLPSWIPGKGRLFPTVGPSLSSVIATKLAVSIQDLTLEGQ